MHVKRYELSLKSWEAGAPKSLHTALEFLRKYNFKWVQNIFRPFQELGNHWSIHLLKQ